MTRINIDTPKSEVSGNLAGHASQESKEVVGAFKGTSNPSLVLVPDPKNATGFRPLTLASHHKSGMKANEAKQESPPLPAAPLLAALKDVDRSVTLIPQIYSHAAQRNVRFAVVLPKNFDANKSYDILGLTPDRPPGTTLAEALDGNELGKRIDAIPGASDKIVILPERIEHRRDAMSGTEHDKLAEAILGEDLVPYVVAGFGAAHDNATVMPYSAPSASPVDGLDTHVTSMPTFSSADKQPKVSTPSALSGFAPKLKSTKTGLMIRVDRDATVVPAGKLNAETIKKLVALPDKWDLGRLKGVDRSVVMLAKTADEPFAVVVPANFDVSRKEPYKVAAFLPPAGVSVGAVAKAIASKGGTSRDDTIVVIPNRKKGESAAVARRRAEYQVLSAVTEAEIDVDLSQYSCNELSTKSASWRTEIQSAATRKRRLQSAVVSQGDRWVQVAPTDNYRVGFAGPAKTGGTEQIPKALQKQSQTQGAMYVPTMASKALGRRVRFATYLPPGYDPEAKEAYPVLLMLPGKGNPLNYWTSAGDVIPKFDRMMSGDAQKMIVVIAENTDSFWYDYDKNGSGDFNEKDKRDYEGHVMELLDYATKSLNGDTDRMSIGGVSRGGFGAMSLAARHPGKFKSVSAHAGLLDLGHAGGVLAPNLTGAIRKEGHFGEAGEEVWGKFNPGDLVRKGAFKGKDAPSLYVDVAFEDPLALEQSVGFSELLKGKGIDHEFRVATSPDVELVHNWAAWEGMLDSWISFHQDVHGTATKPRIPTGWYDGKVQATDWWKKDQTSRIDAVTALRETLIESLDASVIDAASAVADLKDLRPYEWLARNKTSLEGLGEEVEKLKADVTRLVDVDKVPLHAAEVHGDGLANVVERIEKFTSEAVEHAATRYIGTPFVRPEISKKALDTIHADAAKALRGVIKAVPEAKDAVMLLASARPELFGEGKDSITEGRFAEELMKFVDDGVLRKDERKGFVEFLDRMAVKRFDWRRGGYSHSVCSAMNTAFNHPGIILNMIRAARDEKPYKVGGAYSGDGQRFVRPMGDFVAGFRPVKYVESKDLPPARLGYERGFLRAIVDQLAPPGEKLPKERFGKHAGPVAVALQKLTGRETHYSYAFKLRNGRDLAKAIESQGNDGLAMADVFVRMAAGGPEIQLHYPVFYDVDKKDGTVAMQEWNRPPQRVRLADINFLVDKTRNWGVAIYQRPDKDLEPFLTPELQSNWDAIRPDRPKFKPFSPDKWID